MPSRLLTPPKRQHVVSQVVLRRFAVRSRISVFDRQADAIYSKGPRGLFYANLDRHEPWAAEERWNTVETAMPLVYDVLDDRRVHRSPGAQDTLRDLIAVHWVRNWALRETLVAIQDQVVASAIERHRPDTQLLAAGYRQILGLEPAGFESLDWFNRRVHTETMQQEREQLLSKSLSRLFDSARTMMERHALEICYTTDADLLIGDTPVVTMKAGHDGVGPHQEVALGDASIICMPVDPHILVSLGPRPLLATMDGAAVSRVNAHQRRGFHRWLGCAPGGPSDRHLRSTTSARSVRP